MGEAELLREAARAMRDRGDLAAAKSVFAAAQALDDSRDTASDANQAAAVAAMRRMITDGQDGAVSQTEVEPP